MNPYANVQPFDHNAVAQRFQQGRQMRQERDTKNALMDYYGAQMGDDPAAQSLMPVMRANPELGGRLLSQHQERQAKSQQQQIELVGQAAAFADTPEKWDQVIDQLAMEGIPGVEKYKGKFSPALRATIMAKAGVADKQQSDRYIPLQPGGSLARIGPGGQPQIVFQQNDGSQQLGAPVQGGPQLGQVEDGYRFKGGNPADPNAWEPVNGGPTPQASGGFPGY